MTDRQTDGFFAFFSGATLLANWGVSEGLLCSKEIEASFVLSGTNNICHPFSEKTPRSDKQPDGLFFDRTAQQDGKGWVV